MQNVDWNKKQCLILKLKLFGMYEFFYRKNYKEKEFKKYSI